jgi:hypothetical protein
MPQTTTTPPPAPQLPATGFVILRQIIGQKEITEESYKASKNKNRKKPRPAITPLIPVSRTTWLNGVSAGVYPACVKLGLGGRTNAWRVEDIRDFINNMGAVQND